MPSYCEVSIFWQIWVPAVYMQSIWSSIFNDWGKDKLKRMALPEMCCILCNWSWWQSSQIDTRDDEIYQPCLPSQRIFNNAIHIYFFMLFIIDGFLGEKPHLVDPQSDFACGVRCKVHGTLIIPTCWVIFCKLLLYSKPRHGSYVGIRIRIRIRIVFIQQLKVEQYKI